MAKFQIYQSTEAQRASATDVLNAGSLLITVEGNIYVSDGVTQARNLVSRSNTKSVVGVVTS